MLADEIFSELGGPAMVFCWIGVWNVWWLGAYLKPDFVPQAPGGWDGIVRLGNASLALRVGQMEFPPWSRVLIVTFMQTLGGEALGCGPSNRSATSAELLGCDLRPSFQPSCLS